jgi:lipopolysaccharide/colanic/teichoic acid biosynthesis glycosyltransferase
MAIVKLITTFFASLLSRLVAEELNSWSPVIVKRLKDMAIEKLPLSQRERYEEEWSCDLLEIPGNISRIIYSLGLLKAARTIDLQFAQKEQSFLGLLTKRTFDITVASMSLSLGLPVFLLICLAVKLDSRGPIFEKQARIGRKGRKFLLRRFRTTLWEREPYQIGKAPTSCEITRIGVWLRKWSFDELPQFINVISGDMSLVGPRPRYVFEAKQDEGAINRRDDVLPGLIGPWDVSHKILQDGSRRELEDEYAKRISLRHDFAILFRAVKLNFRKPY